MSGHSKWSQIKRTKGAKDQRRGQIFSMLAKKISLAAKEGNSGDPLLNYKLRTEIEAARAQGLPSDNVDRAIKKGLGQDGEASIEEAVYEGYGPFGTAFLVECATDNKNRTVSNIKHLFSKNGGSLGAMGSVAWMFRSMGQIFVETSSNTDELQLAAIDSGADEVRLTEEGLEVYCEPESLLKVKEALEGAGGKIVASEVSKISSQNIELTPQQTPVVEKLYQELEDDEDVTAVYTNASL